MNRTLRRAALPAALALSFGLAACSGSNEQATTSGSGSSESASESSLSGDLSGAGASTQTVAQQTWAAGFQSTNPDVTVNYDPVGSGGGREQFLSGGVPFAGSDAYLKDEELTTAQERCNGGNAIDLPVYVSPIAIAYNLPGVADLKLSPDTIAKIFLGQITTWNDPAIAADNAGVTLPATAITPVHRSDDSGTTQNFTDYLHTAAPSVWTAEPAQAWPVQGGEAAQGTSGVIQAIQGGEGTIGYADESQVTDELGKAQVKVGDAFVGPTAEAAAAVVDASPEVEGRPEGDIAIKLDRATTAAGAYPVVLVSYAVVCSSYEDAAEGEMVKAYMTYITSEEGQQAAADEAGSAPISEKLRGEITTSLELIK
ncbi:phosphate ABC transporter substrate-binding protein PstS [Kineococcus sp. T13]|uniref:phosphate ABC transporter substrate-binding protein PstS n=1 Tax=Kineococcus vitellinus TaxID=2696565 RepID=UPI00141255D8|nr:phosphate ABC transporter substrate-binding protein PstS [Kineococcus vitellinus]